MAKISLDKLEDFIASLSVDNENHSVKFTMIPVDSSHVREENGTKLFDLRAHVGVKDKVTGEEASTPVDLLKIPHYGGTAFTIKGKSKQVISKYTMSYGWYIFEHALKLTNQRGPRLLFLVKDYEIYVTASEKPSEPKVPLASFLKAFTGKSFSELKKQLGADSVYVARSFSIEEPLRVDCIDKVVTSLLTDYTKKDRQIRYMEHSTEERYNILRDRFLDSRAMYLGNTAGVRLKRTVSFRHRAKNTYLGEKVKVQGHVFDKDLNLDARTLEMLDFLPLNTLKVYSSNKKKFVLRKNDVYSFRALGCVLQEDVMLEDTILRKGTVLGIPELRALDQTKLTKLWVSFDDKYISCTRTLLDGSFDIEDTIGILQVFLNNLAGLELEDDMYALTNQNLDTLDIRAADAIKENCARIVSSVTDKSLDYSESQDLFSRLLSMRPLATSSLIDYVESVETKQSQQAEINNIVQKISKEHRIAKDVKRTSDGMVSVQQQQFNKIDAIESPESSKIGAVQSTAYYAREDENGFLAAPLLRVENGEVLSDIPVYLTAEEEEDEYIAAFNETFVEIVDGKERKKKSILAMSSKTFLEVPLQDVRYIQVGPFDGASPSRMLSPFWEHSQPKRLLMNANQNKQTVPVLKAERPMVDTGGASLLAPEGIIEAKEILADFWRTNKNYITEDKEEFCERKITLVKVQSIKDYKVLSFSVEGFPGRLAEVEIPFMQKAASGSMFSYNVNTQTEGVYQGRDVVAHSRDIDIRKYEYEMHANFGRMKIDPVDFERSIALSVNLRVAYKTFGSSTIDDAVLLSEDIVSEDLLTTPELYAITYELQQPKHNSTAGTLEEESFSPPLSNRNPAIGSNGLIRKGEYIRPGDDVIFIKTEKKVFGGRSAGMVLDDARDRAIKAEDVEGQVVWSSIDGLKATVLIASLKQIEPGDKIAGRHGNKGVVARILPVEQMPFDEVTGLHVQVVLNPLGIPSRMNISQTLEVATGRIGWVTGKRQIVTPYVGNTLEHTKDRLKELGLKPTTLIDGRTGKKFDRPMFVGVFYPLRLEHMVDHKIKSVGIYSSVDPVFNQPSKGKGSQAIGEMETWAMRTLRLEDPLQTLMTVQSDDLVGINDAKQAITEDPNNVSVEGNNNNDHLFQVICRGLGTEASYDDNGALWFRPLTDADIKALSLYPIDITNKASLESPAYFGVTSNAMSKFSNRTTWGWMPLHAELVHPFTIVKGNLNKYFLMEKGELRKDKITGAMEVKFSTVPATENFFRDLIASRKYMEFSAEPGSVPRVLDKATDTSRTGMSALVYLLKNYDISTSIYYYQAKLERAKSLKSKLTHLERIKELTDFTNAGGKLSDYVITTLPIMPLAFRPKAKFAHQLQDFDFYYSRIIDEVVKYQSLNHALSDQVEQAVYSIYLRIVEFCGITYGKEATPDPDYKPLLKYFTGREGPDSKHGRVRENMLKKRTRFSGRSVIIPQSDIMRPPTKIGVPFRIVVKALELQLNSMLSSAMESWGISVQTWSDLLDSIATNRARFDDIAKPYAEKQEIRLQEFYNKVYGVISAYVEGYTDPTTGTVITKPQVVLAGRQPTLHKFSIRAYEVVIVHHKCIEIHPLVTTGYNADFDGDQMYIQFLINQADQELALQNASPKQGLINPKDGSLIISPSQDIRLGVYYATMLKDNVDSLEKHEVYKEDPKFYSCAELLSADVELGLVSLHELVVFKQNGRRYYSTAGRILFHTIMPDGKGFTEEEFSNPLKIQNVAVKEFSNLRFDGLVSGSGGSRKTPVYQPMKKILQWAMKEYTKDGYIDFVQKMSEFGFIHSDLSGISFSIFDLEFSPKTDLYIERANKYAEVINDRYFKGVISEEERKNEIIYLYTQMKNRLKKTFMGGFDRNNNLFIMFDSGARGSEDQIMQTVGVIGILQKTKDEVLESPVLTNYGQGVTPWQMNQLSYSARVGVSATQNETATGGELTRKAVYMGQGFTVVEPDCGHGVGPIKITWGDPTGKAKSPDGSVDVVATLLIGKKLSPLSKHLKVLKNFLEEDNVISDRTLSMLLEKKIQRVELEDGVYQILYKTDNFMKSLLLYREVEEGTLKHLIDNKFISEKTLDSIFDSNLETLNVRTILSCKSVGGVCQHCYGLAYDTEELPPVGSCVGIEAAQCIGEPAAQLSMSLFHGGGEAGKSADKGVELYRSTLSSGFSDKLSEATLARFSGYVSLTADKRRPIITTEDGLQKEIHFCKTELTVEDGEYVEKNEPISAGFLMPRDSLENPTEEELQFVQLALLRIHFQIFETNNIDVFVRHFEIFVRVQTSLVTVIASEDENFSPGGRYQLNDILANKTGEVYYSFAVSSADRVVEAFGGVEVKMAHADLAQGLGKAVYAAKRSPQGSFIGRMVQGQPLSGPMKKVFSAPKFVRSAQSDNPWEGQDDKIASALMEEKSYVIETQVAVADTEEIDWGAALGMDDFAEPEVSVPDEVEEETQAPEIEFNFDDEEDSDKDTSDLQKSDKF